MLRDYIIKSSKLNCRLSRKDVCKLACDFASVNNKDVALHGTLIVKLELIGFVVLCKDIKAYR